MCGLQPNDMCSVRRSRVGGAPESALTISAIASKDTLPHKPWERSIFKEMILGRHIRGVCALDRSSYRVQES